MTQRFRVGLFVLTGLAIFSVGTFLIGRQNMEFGSYYRLRSDFHTVAGLNEGADVRVGGIHKGRVRYIRLPKKPDGEVSIYMDLEKETLAVVKKDSVASIQSQGLLGDKYVEISFGSAGAEGLKDGETIESQPPFDVSDLFQKANMILDTSQGALENLSFITGKINGGQGTVGKLINDPTLYQQASAGVTSLHEDADALKHNFFLRGFFKDRGYTNPEDVKKHQSSQLPKEPAAKSFSFDPKTLFDGENTAKLKNQKLLNPAGQFLEEHKFRLAVVVASSGMKGDSDQDRALSEARGYVVRKYLVDNFKLDDMRLQTFGLGKQAGDKAEGGVEIRVYGLDGTPQTKEPARQ
jgi:phospholipid/cholesterol/gamma-HCH transport system substrate-binding protein